MKKIISIFLIAVAALVMSGCRETVPAGFVGVKVDLYGDEKGVQGTPVGVGKYWLSWNEEIYKFPTFNQLENYETPFNFQTKDSMTVGAKIGIEYYVNPEKVTKVFQTYRKGVDEITSINIRQKISDSLIKNSSKTDITSLAEGGKAKLMEAVTADLTRDLDPIGIKIVKVSLLDDLIYPAEIRQAINDKIGATQKAMARENEVAEAKAAADKVIEAARGESESKLLRDTAEAKGIELRGKALQNYPQVIESDKVNKWNGALPLYTGGGAPMVMIK
ncbi:SPFH domain-containing lipoprotein [Aeromonas phage Gekk3-15]